MTSAASPLNMPNNTPPLKVIIVGGSISGLMHGILLKHYGYEVRIFEQTTSLKRADLAAGITTHPEFEEFMKRFDTTGKPWSITSPGIQFLKEDGTIKRRINKPLQMTSWGVLFSHLRSSFDQAGDLDAFKDENGKPRYIFTEYDAKGLEIAKLIGDTTFERGRRVTGVEMDGSSEIRVTFDNLLKEGCPIESAKANLVIIADGHNSKLRDDLFPSVQRTYAGYVAFRGIVPESVVSEESTAIFDQKLTYQTFKNGYILLYIIPGADGSLEVGRRRYNWVWYHHLAADSPEFTEIMTDKFGTLHRNTLPMGTMEPLAWVKYLSLTIKVMCAAFREVVTKTNDPFITAVSDVSCPSAIALDGKAIVVGEALNLMRPHIALSATQSAVQALGMEGVLKGEITTEEWEKRVIHWGRVSALKTNAFGTFFLYGPFSAAGWLCKLVCLCIGRVWPFSLFHSLRNIESWKKK